MSCAGSTARKHQSASSDICTSLQFLESSRKQTQTLAPGAVGRVCVQGQDD